MGRELVGGQALIEGVMMRRGDRWAAAARRPDGSIVTTLHRVDPTLPRLAALPVARGVNALADSVRIGLAAMSWSRRQEQSDHSTPSLRERVVVIAVVVAVVVAFLWLPIAVAAPIGAVGGALVAAVVEGLARLGLFVAYLAMISRLPGVQRTLGYHGAEHMVVTADEHDVPLSIAEVRRFSVRHPRCGTDFFFLIFAVSILVFAAVGDLPIGWLIASRVVLGPIVVGVSYEVLRAAGTRHDTRFGRAMAAPGLALQRFTTREPDDGQIEVAIAAFIALCPADVVAESGVVRPELLEL